MNDVTNATGRPVDRPGIRRAIRSIDPDGGGQAEKPDSLSRQIYAILREDIIRGRYKQGSRLAEQRLAEEMQVSRVPLREAVPLLETDGFVRTFPRRGAVVATWDEKAVDDLFDLRLCIEVGASRFAARRIAEGGSIEPLDAALAYSQDIVHGGDPYEIALSSTRYHEAIVDTAGNELMSSLMRSISGRMMWLFFLTSQLDFADAFQDHVVMRDAIASGNERVAEAVTYAHIERDREPSFTAMRERNYLG
jgi:DNA-binding GntR family transcriptional regulator